LNEELEQRVIERTQQLEVANRELETVNKELEAFSYSVSHDLRAPLRTIDGFTHALLEDYDQHLPEEGQNFLTRIRTATRRMAELIDALLSLAGVTRKSLERVSVDLGALATKIFAELQSQQPDRHVSCSISEDLIVNGDRQLLQIALENLIGNAWKFTAKWEDAHIEVGIQEDIGEQIYFIRDNGAGFNMDYKDRLFGAFQRLHSMAEYPGTGIGLATVQRIIHRHGGRIWAESTIGQGTTFYFTIPEVRL
jgi:light-regulated signal transduction histidine kinase (bacteriophytochrome)